jgi:hypothetical protein
MLCDCDCDCNNPCSLCSVCQSCNQCNTKQSFCATSGQAASNYLNEPYSFGPYNRDDIIIKVMPLSVFNEMGDAAVKIATTIGADGISGTKNSKQAVSNPNASWTHQSTPFLRADKTNELVSLINSIGNSTFVQSNFQPNGNESWPSGGFKSEDIIYGSYFQAIAKSINECKLSPLACDACNTGCDAICLTCNTCNNCQASCQTDDNSGGSGCDCDCNCDTSSED